MNLLGIIILGLFIYAIYFLMRKPKIKEAENIIPAEKKSNKLLYGLLIFAGLILLTYLLPKGTSNNSSPTTSNVEETSKFINGAVGKYTYSYKKTKGMIAVLFDGKGINVGDGSSGIEYQNVMIVAAIRQTINSISGFEDITMDAVQNWKTEDKTIVLKGRNCTYVVAFVWGDDNRITDMLYNDCN